MTEQLEQAVSVRVDSEVGTLRKVIVHRPGLEHTRLTPSNAQELLFDDVIWVKRAKEDHDAFCSVIRYWGGAVLCGEQMLTCGPEVQARRRRAHRLVRLTTTTGSSTPPPCTQWCTPARLTPVRGAPLLKDSGPMEAGRGKRTKKTRLELSAVERQRPH